MVSRLGTVGLERAVASRSVSASRWISAWRTACWRLACRGGRCRARGGLGERVAGGLALGVVSGLQQRPRPVALPGAGGEFVAGAQQDSGLMSIRQVGCPLKDLHPPTDALGRGADGPTILPVEPMKPDTHTVQQLFERDVRYIVPLYQRPYVWDEEHQWAPLWDDITALLQHQEAGDLSGLWSHFLGAIVLEQEQTVPGQIPRFTVIDGQQRLTTLQLLVAAAARAVAGVGAEDDAALLRELAVNNPRKASGTEQLKVWPTNANRVAFTAVMSPGGPPHGHVNDPTNRIDEAFAYFTERVAEYLIGADRDDFAATADEKPQTTAAATPSDEVPAATTSQDARIGTAEEATNGQDPVAVARAERLRIMLCDLLKVVSITLEADDNAQVIFETLNARGTPLLALDLVKNALFYQAARQQRDTDTLYEQVWQPQLDEGYWRQERRQGRLNRPIGELFLMHWLTMRVERVIPATELFATFRQSVLGPATDAEALIRELAADAAVMEAYAKASLKKYRPVAARNEGKKVFSGLL
jgi:Protein of unknown function DUF262